MTESTPTGVKEPVNPKPSCTVCGQAGHTSGYHDNSEPTGYHDNSAPTGTDGN